MENPAGPRFSLWPAALVPLAVEVGLDEVEVREALADRRFGGAVTEDA